MNVWSKRKECENRILFNNKSTFIEKNGEIAFLILAMWENEVGDGMCLNLAPGQFQNKERWSNLQNVHTTTKAYALRKCFRLTGTCLNNSETIPKLN